MSCWVVPTVAAELWGCSVDEVMDSIYRGNVPSKEESGWTFVDVAPESPVMAAAGTSARAEAPATEQVVSQQELEALTGFAIAGHDDSYQPPVEMHEDWRDIRD